MSISESQSTIDKLRRKSGPLKKFSKNIIERLESFEFIVSDSEDAVEAETCLNDDKCNTIYINNKHLTEDLMADCESVGFQNESEKKVYEIQLTQLQEQLFALTIENENLKKEITSIKEDAESKIQKEQYAERLKGAISAKSKPKESSQKVSDVTDIQHSFDNILMECDGPTSFSDKNSPKRVYKSVQVFVKQKYTEFLEDISVSKSPKDFDAEEMDPLSVKKLKGSIVRFRSALQPIFGAVTGLHHVVRWKSPSYTFIVLMIYLFCLYHGYFLSLVLGFFAVQLYLNYLRSRGCAVGIQFLDSGEEEDNDEELKVSDKLILVLNVARRVQNTLAGLADGLEKVKSILCWRHESSRKLFTCVIVFFLLSLMFSATSLFYIMGFYAGLKFFIIDYVYSKFPRLKQKYDTVHQIWQELPTDIQYESQKYKKFVMISDKEASDSILANFSNIFSLPSNEVPLPGWNTGLRCTLVDKHKPITGGGIKNGLLFLTANYVCFLKSKMATKKNLVFPLTDISYIEKSKSNQWLPGKGLGVEVGLHSEKVYVFGAIVNRDKVFEAIISAGQRLRLPWAN